MTNKKPNTTNSELDEILRWQTSAVIEAAVTGKDPKNIKVTEEILNRHKEQAKARLEALIASKVREAQILHLHKVYNMLAKAEIDKRPTALKDIMREVSDMIALQPREQDNE